MYNPQLSIEGIQEVQARNLRRIAVMHTGGAGEDAVRDMGAALHRHTVQITHVGQYEGGGALRAAHRLELDGLEGLIYIDPGAVSPRRGRKKQRPAIYGVFEHERGGEHAFYDRTIEEIGDQAKADASRRILEAVILGE